MANKKNLPALTIEEVQPWWKNKQNRTLAITLFSIITTFVIVWILQVPQRLFKLKAETYIAQVFIQPTNPQILPGANQALKIIATTDKGTAFAAMELTFDAAKMQLTQEIEINSPALTQVVQKTAMADANATGKINLALGQQPGTATPSGTFQIATITVAAKDTAPNTLASLNFTPAAFQFVAVDTQGFTTTGTNSSLTLNYTPIARLYFSPPAPANPQTVNTDFTADVLIDTAGQEIYGADAEITYDRTKIQITRIDPGTEPGFTSYPAKTFNNTNGTAKISANIGGGGSAPVVNGTAINLAKITFKPIAVITSTDVVFNFTAGARNDSNLVLKTTDPKQDPVDILAGVQALTVTANQSSASPSPLASASPSPSPSPSPLASASPSPSPSPSPLASASPSPSPTPTPVTLTVKILFQGRSRLGADNTQNFNLTYKLLSTAATGNMALSTANNGEAQITILPGSYEFLVEASGYLDRRFGSAGNPIIISSDSQYLDLTDVVVLGGDFNNDGTINEIDYTAYFLANFNTANSLTDLDRSGEVNNLDFAIMRANWNLINDTL